MRFMDEKVKDGNAFAIPVFYQSSILAHFDEPATDSVAFKFEPLSLHDEDFGQLATLEDLDPKLPSLQPLNYGPIEDIDPLDTSSVLSTAESFEDPVTLDLDIWSFPLDVSEQENSKLNCWESFYSKTFQEPRTTQVFDTILASQDGDLEDGRFGRNPGCVIESVALVSSLLELGLGRESVLYHYEEHEQSFVPLIADARIPGYSLEAVQNLSATFIDCGNQMKRLQSFIDVTQTSTKSLSTSIALARSIAATITTLHARITGSSKSAPTLPQLQTLFERPGLMMSYLIDLVNKVGKARSEEELLSRVFDFVGDFEHSAEWIRRTMFQILASVSKPWLDAVSKWVGLRETTSAGPHGHDLKSVMVTEGIQSLERHKDTEKLKCDLEQVSMPKFISEEDALIIFETGKSLRLLETHQPEHPLLRPAQAGVIEAPGLDWQFSWRDVERIQLRVQDYELNLRKAIAHFDILGSNSEKAHLQESLKQTEIVTVGLSERTAEAYIHASMARFEKILPDLTAEWGSDSLAKYSYYEMPEKEIYAPQLSLLPVLSFSPVIANQALLINRACLRLLFKEHNIRSHFSLLRRYSLLGDGVFASRLSHALFDPELGSTESRKGGFQAGMSGLNLGSRDTWPPASSELRLALTGILTESYYESARVDERSSMFRRELPGGLSFAIRDMPEDELQRCMDPNSIEALDFLRLQYRPPPPLDAVITPTSLTKYDVIFKLLLRASRMLFVVNQLFRDTNPRFAMRHGGEDPTSKSFRLESHHFVSAICRYFRNGVQACWSILQRRLEDTEKALDHDDSSDGGDSLHHLRGFHESLLDRLMSTLILAKSQAQAMKLIEEIFSMILVFARRTRTEATRDSDSRPDLKETRERFGKKVRSFISVCKGLEERRGEGGSNGREKGERLDEDGGNGIGQLLLDFEMSGFYAK